MDEQEIVLALRRALADRVGHQRYQVWFSTRTNLEITPAGLVITVSTNVVRDFLRRNFRQALAETCQLILGSVPPIAIQTDASLPTGTDPVLGSDAADASGPSLAQDVAAARSARPMSRSGTPRSASQGDLGKQGESSHHQDVSARPEHVTSLAALPRPTAELADFVAEGVNLVALNAAQTAATQPGIYSPLVVYGGSGVGKSHLLQGIVTLARATRPGIRALYLTGEQFTSGFTEAINGRGMPNFRRKYRGLELLVIDDIQFCGGKKGTISELLHTIDTLAATGTQLVVSADRVPGALTELGPELMQRLQEGLPCRLVPADSACRLEIARRWAKRLDVELPPDVTSFLATHLSHVRELIGAIKLLAATAQALKAPVTLASAETVLSELLRPAERVIRLADIDREVCNLCGLEANALRSVDKAKRVTSPRMLAMWLARKHTRVALSEIGQYFGRRSHTTVLSAQRRVSDWMTQHTQLTLADRAFAVEDAIRQVEAKLQAG